jgi:hypothetical protein
MSNDIEWHWMIWYDDDDDDDNDDNDDYYYVTYISIQQV